MRFIYHNYSITHCKYYDSNWYKRHCLWSMDEKNALFGTKRLRSKKSGSAICKPDHKYKLSSHTSPVVCNPITTQSPDSNASFAWLTMKGTFILMLKKMISRVQLPRKLYMWSLMIKITITTGLLDYLLHQKVR